MVDRLVKFLKKQDRKTAELLLRLIEDILKGNLEGCDVKRLAGKKDFFRLRKGRFRIIFEQNTGQFLIKKITVRDDQTYENL